jgi:sugar phosphate isomerase/epimerase
MHVQGWNADAKTHAVVGEDSLDWPRIFAAAKTGGVRNYFVEMSLDLMRASVPYLKSLGTR